MCALTLFLVGPHKLLIGTLRAGHVQAEPSKPMSSRAVKRGAHLRPSARRLLRSKARGVALQHYLDLRHQLRIRWIINCACCPGGGPGSLRLSILVARGHNLEGGVLHTCFIKKNSGAWRPDQYMHACCVEPTPAFVRGPYVENSSKQFQSRSTLKGDEFPVTERIWLPSRTPNTPQRSPTALFVPP